jgi:predicted tellurium resistance membrane protein TerC
MFELFSSSEAWLSLLTLSALEVVLGLDNIIFISILTGRLPPEKRDRGRKLGLVGAFGSRLVLLCFAAWLVQLTRPLFGVWGLEFSGKSLLLILGGLFLLYKATHELHDKLEGDEESETARAAKELVSFTTVILQVTVLDIVFSIDSVITAVGLTHHLPIMIAANVIALFVMLWASGVIGRFVERHPTIKVLALSFLLMIGLVLVAEGFGAHIPKGYVYFAMGFSVFVEFINIRVSKKNRPVHLRDTPHVDDPRG